MHNLSGLFGELPKDRIVFNLVFTKKEGGMYMNKQESDIMNSLLLEPFINQRILAEVSGHSLGVDILQRWLL